MKSSTQWDLTPRAVFCSLSKEPESYRILVPQPGIEPGALAVKARSPNHWTAREFPPRTFSKAANWTKHLVSVLQVHSLHTTPTKLALCYSDILSPGARHLVGSFY